MSVEGCDGTVDWTHGAAEFDPLTRVDRLGIAAADDLLLVVAVVTIDVSETVAVFINWHDIWPTHTHNELHPTGQYIHKTSEILFPANHIAQYW